MTFFLHLVFFSLALSQDSSSTGEYMECTADSNCASDSYCQSRTCTRYAQTGESCGGTMPPIGRCQPGFDCVLPYNPGVTDLPGRCGRGCRTNTDCNSSSFCDIPSMNCILYLHEGDICETGATETCVSGLTCSNGRCVSTSSTTYPLQGAPSSSYEYSTGTYGSPSSQAPSSESAGGDVVSSSGVPMSGSMSTTGISTAYSSQQTGSMSTTGPLAGSSSQMSSSEQTGSMSTTGPLAGSSSEESGSESGPSSSTGYPSSPSGWASSGYSSPSSSTSWGGKGKKKGCGGFVIGGNDGSTGEQNGPDGAPSAGANCSTDVDCSGAGKFCSPMTNTCMTYKQLGENCGNAGTLTPIECAPGLRCLAQRPLPGSPRVCANDNNVTCPPRLPAVSCFTDPCNISSCEGYPNATCIADYCGGCNTKWSMGGEAVQCKTVNCTGMFNCPEIPTSCNTTMVPFGRCCPVCADCQTIFCPATFCDNPVKTPGACCPVCPSNPGIPIPPPRKPGNGSPMNP